jgi:MscS family membrane protein
MFSKIVSFFEYLQTFILSLLINIDYIFILNAFLLFLLTASIHYLWIKIDRKMNVYYKKTGHIWRAVIVRALSKPMLYFIWGVSFWNTSQYYLQHHFNVIFKSIYLILLIAWIALRLIHLIENKMKEKQKKSPQKFDRSTIEAVSKLLRASIGITSFLFILQSFGISLDAVLAFGGIGGIAIGFAAKDLLANFFGGLMIYLDRPFSVGDWIRSSEQNIEGIVEYIGWRQTLIRTFDKRPLYVPNALFNHITLENPSRMTHRRFYETFTLRYDDFKQLPPIIEQIKSMLLAHSDIDTNETLMVNFNHFSESSVDFFVYTFTKTTDWVQFHQIKQQLLILIADIIASNHAEFSYPVHRLQIDPPFDFKNQ